MNKIWNIANKELNNYFQSPFSYLIVMITIGIFNLFFYMIIEQGGEATLRDIYKVMEFLFIFIIPLITMRVLAEEKASGTMEFLMTTPTSTTQIVCGKYVGAMMFFSIILFPTLIYVIILANFSRPDFSALWCGLLGVWLEGALLTAVGVMVSSWSRYQFVAALCGYAINFMLYFSLALIQYTSGRWQDALRFISTSSHFENLSTGILTLSDIVYYVTGIIFCLLFTRLCLERT